MSRMYARRREMYRVFDRTANAAEPPLIASLLTQRNNVAWNLTGHYVVPLDIETATIAEQRPPHTVADVNHDSETPRGVVVPLAHVSHPAEQHRKTEPDYALVKALRTGTQPKPTFGVDRQLNIDSQVFVVSRGSRRSSDECRCKPCRRRIAAFASIRTYESTKPFRGQTDRQRRSSRW